MICNGTALVAAYPILNMMTGKDKLHGVSHGLSEAGYDIRIAQGITFAPNMIGEGMYHYVFDSEGKCGPVEKGRFVLASAIEEFHMPIDLVGVVHDKSTWARQGLSVFNTVIEPGWRGFLTLELVYHGEDFFQILPGTGIAQVLFHGLEYHAEYTGKYQDQDSGPVGSKFE